MTDPTALSDAAITSGAPSNPEDLVERMARAICAGQPHMKAMHRINACDWSIELEETWKGHVRDAHAALASLAGSGWRLVPEVATGDIRAAIANTRFRNSKSGDDVYAAMLSAAPQPFGVRGNG